MMRTLLKCAGVVAMAAVWGGVAWGQTPSITPTTLPNGEVGVAYNQTLDAGDALPTCCTWAPTGALGNGLSLTPIASGSTATISGTPTAAVPVTFTVTATDLLVSSDPVSYTITIFA